MYPELKTQACPERQIISLYLDGELPAPWKGKMEGHLESCLKCRNILEGYRAVGTVLKNSDHDAPGEPMGTARERVWQKLTAPQLIISRDNVPGSMENNKSSRIRYLAADKIWKKNITLPLPAAAVILILFFALLGFMGLFNPARSSSQMPQEMMMARIVDDQGMVPMQDMNGVLQYLSSQDNGGDFMVIRLPESKRFSRVGEPALINAADYSRRLNSR